MPAVPLRTWVLALASDALSADRLSYLLRRNEPPVVARISNDEVLIDLRTLLDGEDAIVLQALERIAPPPS